MESKSADKSPNSFSLADAPSKWESHHFPQLQLPFSQPTPLIPGRPTQPESHSHRLPRPLVGPSRIPDHGHDDSAAGVRNPPNPTQTMGLAMSRSESPDETIVSQTGTALFHSAYSTMPSPTLSHAGSMAEQTPPHAMNHADNRNRNAGATDAAGLKSDAAVIVPDQEWHARSLTTPSTAYPTPALTTPSRSPPLHPPTPRAALSHSSVASSYPSAKQINFHSATGYPAPLTSLDTALMHGTSLYTGASMYQELLPLKKESAKLMTIEEEMSLLTSSANLRPAQQYRDVFFACIYVMLLLTMFLSGSIYIATTSPLSTAFRGTLSFALFSSQSYLLSAIALSMLVGLIWLVLLRRFIGGVVWLIILAAPITFFAMGVWGLQMSFSPVPNGNPGLQPKWLIPEALLSFLLGFLSTVVIHRRRQHIRRGIRLVQLAFRVLADNPTVFAISLGLVLVFGVFLLAWCAIFTRILLVGHIQVEQAAAHPLRQWVPEPSSIGLLVFYVVMFLWTSAVLAYLDRCVISGAVCEWYFHRQDPLRSSNQRDRAWGALRRSITFMLGSICLASMIMTVVYCLRIWLQLARKASRWSGFSWLNSFVACFESVEGWVESLNSFAIVYMAYSGEGFFESARQCFRLFQRNLISALVMDQVAKFVLQMGLYALSMASFFFAYRFAAEVTETPHAYAIALLGSLLPCLMIRFCAFVVVQVMDSLYVCYVIDLDSKQSHCPAAHEIFADTGSGITGPVKTGPAMPV